MFSLNNQVLNLNILNQNWKTPITTASGTFGFGQEMLPFFNRENLGALTVKGITPLKREGNPGQRLIETPAGLINSVGLMNPGLEGFIEEEMPQLNQLDLPIIVNINGSTVEDYGLMTERLDKIPGIYALEVNISCPNVKEGGMAFGVKAESAAAVVKLARSKTKLPLIVKLSPNVTDIAYMAQVVENEGADAISLINTVLAMDIDINKRRPVLNNVIGGLSGPAIMPIALRMVYEVFAAVDLPVIGMGGISSWQDALKFMMAGASAFALGTANFVDLSVIDHVASGLRQWCQKEGVKNITEIIGSAQI